MKLSVIIPVYNEAKIIEKNVMRVYSEIKKISNNFEIIICDDSSTDLSPEISQELARKFREIKYVSYQNGPSRRENLALTIKHAKGDIIAYLDSDLAVNPSYISRLVSGIENGYDVVVGSRYVRGAISERRFLRWVISKFYNFLVQLYFGSRILDHQCGFKAFKRDVALRLVDKLGYDSRFRRGWFWDAELLIRAQLDRFRILEIPIVWTYGNRSTFKLMREIKMIPYVIPLKWRL